MEEKKTLLHIYQDDEDITTELNVGGKDDRDLLTAALVDLMTRNQKALLMMAVALTIAKNEIKANGSGHNGFLKLKEDKPVS